MRHVMSEEHNIVGLDVQQQNNAGLAGANMFFVHNQIKI